jgi:hypothetical protein
MPEDARMRYLSWHIREHRQDELNPVCLEGFSEEKLTFARYCEALGIPVPATYGTIGADGTVWSPATGRVGRGAEAFAHVVRRELPEEFVVKPVFGYLGLGVRVLRRDGDGLVDADGRRLDPGDLLREVADDPLFGLHVIQERLRNHPGVEALHASDMLQTSRLTTLVTPDGDTRLLFVSLKLGTGRGGSDNYRLGETGNGVAYVRDLATGELGPALVPRADGLGVTSGEAVPGSGRRIEGARMPLYAECVELVRRAAPGLLPMRTLGWDVALTARGPVVVEANNWWASPLAPLSDEARALFFGP